MKKISSILISCVAALSLQADIDVASGNWQMVGTGVDWNLSEDSSLTSDNFSIIWYWDNGKWRAFSKDKNIKNIIQSISGLWGDYVKKGRAFWIKAKKDIRFIPYVPRMESLPHTKGWHMISFIDWIDVGLLQIFNNQPPLKAFFAYRDRDGKWSYIYRKNSDDIIGNLKNVNPLEGLWSYLENNISDNLYMYSSHKTNENNLANKTLTLSNGLELTLDQNGTVISNDANYSNMNWFVSYSNNYAGKIEIYNRKNLYDLRYYCEFENSSCQIDSFIHITGTISPNGISIIDSINDENVSNLTLTISDYKKEKQIVGDIKSIMDSIKKLLSNGNVSAQGVLDGAKAVCLSYSNNNDAKVVLAIVNILETLNSDIVSQSFTIDGNPLDANSYFKKMTVVPNPSDLIKLSQSISSYPQNATNLLETLANNLVSSADKLEDVSKDKNYVFAYEGLNGKKLNYVDITMLRSVMYLLAYKLEFLSSYQLGTNEWLKPIKEGNIEYSKALANPAEFLNSRTFFINPNQEKLNKAKSLLIKSLQLYYGLLENKNYDKGLYVKSDDITTKNVKRKVFQILQNLTGKTQYAILMDDKIEQNWNEETQHLARKDVVEKYFINLNNLFDANSTITINDFPTFKYNGVYNENISKLYNEPRDSSAKELELIYDQKPASPNHINNIILKVIKEDGTVLKGVNLLNELFKD